MVYLSEHSRSQIVTLRDIGKTWTDIISIMKNEYHVNITKNGCQKLYKKYKERGHIQSLQKQGRPLKIDKRDQRVIRRTCMANRHLTANQLAAEFNSSSEIKVSRATVNRILLKYGLKSCVPKRKPLLNHRQRQARYEWAKRFAHWDSQHWMRVCFSDESIFKCFSDSRTAKIRRRSDEAYLPQCLGSTVKHGPQMHVFGIIGQYGAGPMKLIRGKIDSSKYQQDILTDPPIKQVCESIIFPLKDAIFQQDRAPCHWSKSTKNFLADRNVPLLPWPGNSPDINPIENVWGIIGQIIRKKKITNSALLYREVQEIWYGLQPQLLQNLYKSMSQRVAAIIKARGGPTKY